MSKVCSSLLLLCVGACVELEPASDTTVDRPRIVAVIATPAEVAPSASVHYRAVIAAPDMTPVPSLQWSFCTTPRGPSDNAAAAPACATNVERAIASTQLEIDVPVPGDACMRFGSETPSGRAPNRADGTGGYYQPLRIELAGGGVTLFRQRIACALPNAPLSVARDYAQRYVPNTAPRIQAIRVLAGGVTLDANAVPQLRALTVELEVADDARESYLLFDPHTGELTTKQEELSAAWFTSAGVFDEAMTSIPATSVQNQLRRPGTGVVAQVWIVLRDDRGGSTVQQQTLRLSGPSP